MDAISKLLPGGFGLTFGIVVCLCALVVARALYEAYFTPLAKVPNAHPTAPFSSAWILWNKRRQRENRARHAAHQRLGPVIRIGPKEISIDCMENGVRSVYGSYDKHSWYIAAFRGDSAPYSFILLPHAAHAERRRMYSTIYTKTSVTSSPRVPAIYQKIIEGSFRKKISNAAASSQSLEVLAMNKSCFIDISTAWIFGLDLATNFVSDEAAASQILTAFALGSTDFFLRSEFSGLMDLWDRLKLPSGKYDIFTSGSFVQNWIAELCKNASLAAQAKPALIDSKPAINSLTVFEVLRYNMKESGMSDEQAQSVLCAEALDQMIASYDVSGTVLTYLMFELSLHGSLQSRLREELSGLRDRTQATPQELDGLPVLDAILLETLRIHPVTPGPWPRVVPKAGARIGPFDNIPGGTKISASSWTLHRHADVFPLPDKWRPERWLEASAEKRSEMMRWMWSFGSGARMCVGTHFANRTLKYIAASVYTDFETSVAQHDGMEDADGVVSGPVGGYLQLSFKRVKTVSAKASSQPGEGDFRLPAGKRAAKAAIPFPHFRDMMAPCTICKSLQCQIESDGSRRDGTIASGDKSALLRSAEGGCVSCSIIWKAIVAFEPHHGRIHSTWVLRIRDGMLGVSYPVIIDGKGSASKWSRVLDLYTTNDSVTQWPAMCQARDVDTDTSSSRNIREMQEWLEDCWQNHDGCAIGPRMSVLPTRVLDVSDGYVRLWESRGHVAAYVALSHCWSKFQLLRTLSGNIEKHQAEIRMDELSRTFQDAIEVTRTLGIQFLWIDSLCIIQDSKEDWERESSLMAKVYGESYLTILATASSDGRGGLFRRRDAEKKSSISSVLEGQDIEVNVRRSLSHDPYWKFKIGLGDPVLPLLERSWCFQEFILSPRIAHFAEDEILWNCGVERGCNCRVTSKSSDGRDLLKFQITQARNNPVRRRGDVYCSVEGHTHAVWWDLVRAYTTKALTHDSDRLPALSGVAKFIQQQSNDRYLAGMWESTLADELFWRVLPNPTLKGEDLIKVGSYRPGEYRAPSWSWASVNAQIHHVGVHGTAPNSSKILAAECIAAGADPTGAVSRGTLSLEAVLISGHAWFDCGEGLHYMRHTENCEALPAFLWEPDVASECEDMPEDPLDIAVLWWSWESQNGASALVLRPVESCIYQRLGILQTDEAFVGEEYDWNQIQNLLCAVQPSIFKII